MRLDARGFIFLVLRHWMHYALTLGRWNTRKVYKSIRRTFQLGVNYSWFISLLFKIFLSFKFRNRSLVMTVHFCADRLSCIKIRFIIKIFTQHLMLWPDCSVFSWIHLPWPKMIYYYYLNQILYLAIYSFDSLLFSYISYLKMRALNRKESCPCIIEKSLIWL